MIEEFYYKQMAFTSIESKIEDLKQEEKNIIENIQKKENSLTLIYEDKINAVINTQEFIIIKNRINVDLQKLKERLKQIDIEINILKDKENKKINISDNLYVDKLNRRLLDEFISSIYIFCFDEEKNSRKISIQWNIKL